MTARQLLNNYLFAPARYLDNVGHVAHGGTLKKTFAAAETKAGMLTAACFVAAFTLAGDDKSKNDTLKTAGIYLAAQALVTRIRSTSQGGRYYFDTQPDTPPTMPKASILLDLNKSITKAPSKIASDVVFWGALGGGSIVLLGSNVTQVSTYAAVACVAEVTNTLSKAWCANEALEGNWAVLESKPPKEPKKELAIAKAEPAPAFVHL